MNIFEYATRQKIRFETDRGALSVEQIWDLPMKSNTGKLDLNGIAIGIAQKLRDFTELSFVESRPDPAKQDLEIKLELVKHIIAAKQADNAAMLDAKKIADRKARLTEVLASKQDAALHAMSEEDLRKELASLGA